ncbi:hypothetical protein CYLTODRAFT_418659 [Cylindrobasidium torrendii FP15055 ss-10]|uniref:Uncharacterized protein n=1 Tax=Cylindrobasidium torrendii FP15055 ss-10 TaxID=1314674 RepID=A0A0D7BPR5_9AGAR|nr:hypothetical protein CYLTODRAFT_418659 [Cylindrobasidium torrendii FP15055 ss-10]
MPSNFAQPEFISVKEHRVESFADWPGPTRSIAEALLLVALPPSPQDVKDMKLSSRISSLTFDHDMLSDAHALALYAASSVTQLASLDQPLDEIPKAIFAKRFLYLLLRCIWPGEHTSLDVPLALAVDPSLYDTIEIAFLSSTSSHVCALGLVTSPLAVPEESGSSEMQSIEHDSAAELVMDHLALEDEAEEAVISSSSDRKRSDYEPRVFFEDTDDYGPDPLPLHVHLAVQPLDDRVVDFPLLCIASPSTVHHVMSSALLHRRTLGVQDPLVCVVLDKYSSTLQLAIGWTEGSRRKVEVHLAYGETHCPSYDRGVFDVQSATDAFHLAICLMAFHDKAASVVPLAHDSLLAALTSPSSILCWRLDQAEMSVGDPTSRIQTWACDVHEAMRPDSSVTLAPSTVDNLGSDATMHLSEPPAWLPIPKRGLNWYNNVFIEELDHTNTAEEFAPYLYVHWLEPPEPSVFAAARSYPHTAGLSISTLYNLNRFTVMCLYPPASETDEPLPVYEPLLKCMHYFRPVAVPDMPTEIPLNCIAAYEAYTRHVKHTGMLHTAVSGEATSTSQYSDEIAEHLLSHFAAIITESNLAQMFDRDHEEGGKAAEDEVEGRVVGWDQIHLRILAEPANSDYALFVGFKRALWTARNKMLNSSVDDPFLSDLQALLTSTLPEMNQAVNRSLQKRDKYVLANTAKAGLLSDIAEQLVEGELELPSMFNIDQPMHEIAWDKLRRVILTSSGHFVLARAVEEPRQTQCDVLAGIRLPCFAEKDQERVSAFNSLKNSSTDKTPQPSVDARALQAAFEKVTPPLIISSMIDDYNPFKQNNVPDEKVLADLLDEHITVGTGSSRTKELRTILEASQTQARSDTPTDLADIPLEPLLDIVLSFYSAEHKRKNGTVFQSMAKAYMYLQSAVAQNVAVGIGDELVFCLVTNGPIGVVLSAWSVRADSLGPSHGSVPGATPITVIAARNAPKYDIREPNQALRFGTFLLHLKHVHAPRLAKRFNEARTAFMKRWDDQDESLQWTMDKQANSTKSSARFKAELDARVRLAARFRLRGRHDSVDTCNLNYLEALQDFAPVFVY